MSTSSSQVLTLVTSPPQVAALAMDDMIAWMQEGGQVGIFDATNRTRKRRNMLMKMAEGKCKIIFLETICNDERIIERNIRLKIQQSPDYAETDFEAGYQDFKKRVENYEKVYEPVEEGSYIKMIDMVSGQGGQIQRSCLLLVRKLHCKVDHQERLSALLVYTNVGQCISTLISFSWHMLDGVLGVEKSGPFSVDFYVNNISGWLSSWKNCLLLGSKSDKKILEVLLP